MSERLTTSPRWEDVNNPQRVRVVNNVAACERVNHSDQQQRILELAARPRGVSSHEAVIAIGGDRLQVRVVTSPYMAEAVSHQIVGTKAARSVAASVSRSLSRLLRLGLIEYRRHPARHLSDGRVFESPCGRYHALARRSQ